MQKSNDFVMQKITEPSEIIINTLRGLITRIINRQFFQIDNFEIIYVI